MSPELEKIADLFGITGIHRITELKKGHINQTFLVECSEGLFVMQSLNRKVFKAPEIIMSNIALVSSAFEKTPDCVVDIPRFLECEGRNYAGFKGGIWRAYRYTERSGAYSPFSHGLAVGRFLKAVNSGNICFRDNLAGLHRKFLDLPLPIRNIHGDTRADNIIFGERLTVIDLDTLSRNCIAADYGDMIRSVTSEKYDPTAVYEATRGFAEGISGLLTHEEIGSLYGGVLMMIRELMERYIQGNRNFPNKTPEQCLERADQLAAQLKDIQSHESGFSEIIRECFP